MRSQNPRFSQRMLEVLVLLLCCLIGSISGQECKTLAYVNNIMSRRHWTGEHISLIYGNASDYSLVRKLGQGSFGEAYLGSNRKLDLACVIKIYTSKMMYIKMLREILLLQTVCGGPNIMKVYDVIRESTEGHPALILEYVQSSDAEVDAVYQSLSPADVQYYMKQLLIALAHVHKMEVIHRDVKPHNVLIDPQRRILRLIDFGLSVFHEPDVVNKTLVGTKIYEAPEMILHIRKYDYKVDMWSYGVMFTSLMLRKFPLFHGSSSDAMKVSIVKVLGAEDLITYLEHIGRAPNASEPLYQEQASRRDWKELAHAGSEAYLIPEAVDLIDHLLRWNPDDRLSAKDALKHPYFSVNIPAANATRNRVRRRW